MDQRARFDDFDELLETLRDAVQSKIRKASPVKLTEDSADGHTAELQILVQSVFRNADGSVELITPSPLSKIPTYFAGANGIVTTQALKAGDEGLIVGTDANFDFWHQQGDIQPPSDARQHTASDSVFLAGLRSDPNKLKGVSKNSTQTRTVDKSCLHDISHDAVTGIRDTSAHQVAKDAVKAEKGGSRHLVDAQGIQSEGGKFFWNC